MFLLEKQMTPIVRQWMSDQGFGIISEFQHPSGYCDLAGIQFDQERVQKRIKSKQARPIKGMFAFAQALTEECSITDGEHIHQDYYKRKLARFDIENDNLRLLVDWLPFHKNIIAVELKLNKISEVISQAIGNFSFANQSYIAMPIEIAQKLIDHEKVIEHGLGVLGVLDNSVLRLRMPDKFVHNKGLHFHAAEKFWTVRNKKPKTILQKP